MGQGCTDAAGSSGNPAYFVFEKICFHNGDIGLILILGIAVLTGQF
jgi:hypothetical protein